MFLKNMRNGNDNNAFDPYNTANAAKSHTENAVNDEMNRSISSNRRNLLFCLVVLIIFAVFTLMSNQKGISVLPGKTAFSIVGLDGAEHKFSYDDVSSVELGEDFPSFEKGTFVDGTESKRCCSGTFRNEAYGEYQLHIDLKIKRYIVVHTEEMTIVFNYESNDTTEAMYEALQGYTSA